MSNKNIGVINEQGFVAGSGLGFNPVAESDLNKESRPNEPSADIQPSTPTKPKTTK